MRGLCAPPLPVRARRVCGWRRLPCGALRAQDGHGRAEPWHGGEPLGAYVAWEGGPPQLLALWPVPPPPACPRAPFATAFTCCVRCARVHTAPAVKKRIKATGNVAKLTGVMKMVASAKLKFVEERLARGKPFGVRIRAVGARTYRVGACV